VTGSLAEASSRATAAERRVEERRPVGWLSPCLSRGDCFSGKSRERHAEGGQTTQKAEISLRDVWTSQPEQLLPFPL